MTKFGKRVAALSPEQRRKLEERLLARVVTTARVGPRPPDTAPRLSFGQQRLWRLCRLMPDTAAYNMHSSHRLRGPLDIEALGAALDTVIARNGALRTVFSSDDGRPQPASPHRPHLSPIDITTEPDPLVPIAAWADRPLDIRAGPLFTARLWRLGPEDHMLSLLTHHLVCDGWSMRLIEDQVARLALDPDRGNDQLSLDYADFVEWERSREESLRVDLDRWSSTLAGVEPLRLPGDRFGESGEVCFDLSDAATEAIGRLAASARSTPFTVLLAIFATTIHRHTGQEDLVVCTPVAGRPDPALERIVGYFNDLVPLRLSLAGDPPLDALIDRCRPVVLDALDRPVPFQWIAGLAATRSTPLTRALFALNDVPAADFTLPGVTAEAVHLPAGASDFELGWFMRVENGHYAATVSYRSSSAETVRRLTGDFAAYAEALTGNVRTTLSPPPDPSPAASPSQTASVAVQPRSLLQSQLRQIWQRVFGLPIGIDDDFFELGGHSLLAAELVDEIEQELSCGRIPLATLFAAPTVARMAALLEQDDWSSGWASLVPIKPSGDRTPLFFVHGHGGNVIGFSDLGRNLSVDQPLYGLQAPGMDSTCGARHIEDMARGYVQEIRTVQPSGPYLVGGWCLGGDIAFEMAQQLRREGLPVALVLMVDNPRPEHIRTAPSSGASHVRNRVGARLAMEWSNLAEVATRQQGRYIMERTARLGRTARSAVERLTTDGSGRLPLGLPHSRSYRQTQIAALHEKAYETYRPQPYAGRVAVLRAEHQPWGRAPDPSLGWSAVVDGPMMLYTLPGHRIGLLEGPRARRVSAIVEEAMRAALHPGAVPQP